MRNLTVVMVLTVGFAVASSESSSQPPKGPKGGPKNTLSEAELVDDIVKRMMAFDKNKDGALTRDEITDARLLRLFDRADANKDGVVTQEELLAIAKQMVTEVMSEGIGKGGKGPKGPKGPGDF